MNNLNYRIYHIISAAWRQRYVICIPILILPFIGLSISVTSPKHYSSHTSMLIQETAKMNPFLEDMAIPFMLKERIDTLKTLLHSRHILGSVARELNILSPESTPQEHDEVIAILSNSLSVKLAGRDLIRIDYRSDDKNEMKETLEVISHQFIEQLLAPERSSMKDSTNFLSQHLKERQIALDEAEGKLAKFKNLHAKDLPELHPSNINRLEKLKQRLSERKAELAGAERTLGGIDQQLSKTNPVLGRIEEQIIRIRGELALNRARYTDKHSLIQAALRNLRRLEEERQNILSSTEGIIDVKRLLSMATSVPANADKKKQPLLISQLENLQVTRSKVDGLSEEIKSLQAMTTSLEKQTSSYGMNSSEFSRLERDVNIKRDLYDDLLLRNEKARITRSLGVFEQDKRVKIIDRPFTPTFPSNLPLVYFILAGILSGILLGVGLAIAFEISDGTLRHRKQLEEITNAPLLTRIPPLKLALEEL